MIEKIDEIDIAIEISDLMTQLLHHAADLQLFIFDDVGQESGEPERVPFLFAKGGRFGQSRIE
jgi:hypothetical protein